MKETVYKRLKHFDDFYVSFGRAVLIKDNALYSEYVGEDVGKLAKGRYIDSTLEITGSHYFGTTIIFFVKSGK